MPVTEAALAASASVVRHAISDSLSNGSIPSRRLGAAAAAAVAAHGHDHCDVTVTVPGRHCPGSLSGGPAAGPSRATVRAGQAPGQWLTARPRRRWLQPRWHCKAGRAAPTVSSLRLRSPLSSGPSAAARAGAGPLSPSVRTERGGTLAAEDAS